MGAKKMNISVPNSPEFKSEATKILRLVEAIEGSSSAKEWVKSILEEAVSDNVVPDSTDKQLSTQEAANMLQISRTHLRRLIDAGYLPYVQVGTHRRIKLRALMDYKKSCERQSEGLTEIARLGEEIEDGD